MSEDINKPLSVNAAEANKVRFEGLKLPQTIVVTSGSEIKIDTVRGALAELFPGRSFMVKGIKADSGVNEQPVGKEAEEGARNRIRHAVDTLKKDEPTTEGAFISVESGIFQVDDNEWEDRAVVVIELPDGRTFRGESKGVKFPTEAVEEARSREGGFKNHTVGSIIAEQFNAKGIFADKQDPQTALTGGTFTRKQQMLGAITAAFLKAAEAA